MQTMMMSVMATVVTASAMGNTGISEMIYQPDLAAAAYTVNDRYTVYQAFEVTGVAGWRVDCMGAYAISLSASPGLTGTLMPDDGAGAPDESSPLATFIIPAFPAWSLVEGPVGVVLTPGTYWVRWTQQTPGATGGVRAATAGSNALSFDDDIDLFTEVEPTVVTIRGIDIDPDCPGDVNGDDIVDFADLNLVLGNWGTAGPVGDVVPTLGDGAVNFDDLNAVIGGWGDSCD